MYESWYLEQYDQYNDGFYKDFDIFGLKSQGSDTRLGQLERLEAENILDWIEDTEKGQVTPEYGCLRLLYVLRSPSINVFEFSLHLGSLDTRGMNTTK
jgi:hypothetical protein